MQNKYPREQLPTKGDANLGHVDGNRCVLQDEGTRVRIQ